MNDYPIGTEMQKRLDNDYVYHSPKGNQQDRYLLLREQAKALAELIVKNTPPSREQSVALTHLEASIFYANAAIARNENDIK